LGLYGESGDSNKYLFIDIFFKTNCLDQLAINESILVVFELNVEATAFKAYYL